MSDTEAKRWGKAAEPVIANYNKDLMAKGFRSDEIDGWISCIRERVDFWEKKAKEQGTKHYGNKE